MKNGSIDRVRELQEENRELRKRFEETAMELSDMVEERYAAKGALDNLSVIVNNERYKII